MSDKKAFVSCFTGALMIFIFTITPAMSLLLWEQNVNRDVLVSLALVGTIVMIILSIGFATMMLLLYTGTKSEMGEYQPDVVYEIGQNMIWYWNPIGWIGLASIWVLRKCPLLCLIAAVVLPK